MRKLIAYWDNFVHYVHELTRPNINNLRPAHCERIVCAANKLKCGIILLGARHIDGLMINQMGRVNLPMDKMAESEQGFINNYGTFLTRKQAWKVAVKAHQIVRRVGGDEECLYSENLY